MTYLNFLLLFIGIPITVLGTYTYFYPHPDKKYFLKGILVLCGLAFVYTTPWDNYLLAQKVWWYGPDRILFTIGYVPIEEYTFFLVQPIMTGLWTFLILNHTLKLKPADPKNKILKLMKFFGLLLILGVLIYGVQALFYERSFYMGLILAWATPIVLLQFAIGGQHILANLKIFLLSSLTPTLYLWRADLFALQDGIWDISEKHTLGYGLGDLPLEEMVFFLITNLMVVQGLLLFLVMRNTVNEVLAFIKSRVVIFK